MKTPVFNRRSMLRGVVGGGATVLGLPLLDMFLDGNGTALASGAPLPSRFATFFWGLGLTPTRWEPATEGRDYITPPQLSFLEGDLKKKATVFTGFTVNLNGRPSHPHWTGMAAIMTGHGEIPLAVQAIELGAIAFLEKPFSHQSLSSTVLKGQARLPKAIAKSARFRAARQLGASLSPRQREVFDGVVEGLTSKEIARRHGLSHRTVESYRVDMMNKLGGGTLLDLLELKAALAEIQGEP